MGKEDRMDRVIGQMVEKLNRHLSSSGQKIVVTTDGVNAEVSNLVWQREIDEQSIAEEYIFGGSSFELFTALTGIEYGIRMQKLQSQRGR